MRLNKRVAELIQWERVCRVATASAEGVPHVVPVCYVVDDGKVYFGSGKDGRKVQHVRANPRIAVTVDIYTDSWAHLKGAMVQGTVAVIERGPRFRKVRALLYRKYPQYPRDAALDESDSVIVEITPTHVFSWGLD